GTFRIADALADWSEHSMTWRLDFRGLAAYLRWFYAGTLLVALALFGLFFALNGWGRLWACDLGRFEIDTARSRHFARQLRLLLVSVLGLVGAVGVGLRGVRVLAAAGLAACTLTFLVVASGFSTVLVLVAVLAALGMMPRRSRWIGL